MQKDRDIQNEDAQYDESTCVHSSPCKVRTTCFAATKQKALTVPQHHGVSFSRAVGGPGVPSAYLDSEDDMARRIMHES